MTLKIFSFFHLNLAYSSIQTDRRQDVIHRCYWPLLRLARDRKLPFGIEISAWTLETIAELDPNWLYQLRELVRDGTCELIGCGYAQVIGPLVPAEVNAANFRIGMQRYEDLLGVRPKIALVNEQAYSSGLVPLYLEAGYESLIMEWNNPVRAHPEWDREWGYLPQYACGTNDTEIPLIWNHSIAFQKMQRYVHGEIELPEYLDYVLSHQSNATRAFSLYGNDVEVFDFRPGRFLTEAPIKAESEWQRIDAIYEALQKRADLEIVPPSAVLHLFEHSDAGHKLHLETASHPVPVKKQDKYNLLRWAVSGRDDLAINTQCWQIFEAMRQSNAHPNDTDWAELCYLWSSDFRTHITEDRWKEYRARLKAFQNQWCIDEPLLSTRHLDTAACSPFVNPEINAIRNGRFLDIQGRRFKLRLNCLRGMALDELLDNTISNLPLIKTLHHGYFDDISWAADFYSGHLVFESPGRAKITDLVEVDPQISWVNNSLLVSATIQSPIGTIHKQWSIDESVGEIKLSYQLDWMHSELGSLRLGYLTLNPEAFSMDSLRYETHNGGRDIETFKFNDSNFDHGDPVSFLVSANQAVGLTEGLLSISDHQKKIEIRTHKKQCAALVLVSNHKITDKSLTRFAFTLSEMDDTSRGFSNRNLEIGISILPKGPK